MSMISIRQAILHIADNTKEKPDFSSAAMPIDAETNEYLQAKIERFAASEEVRCCSFLSESAFAAELSSNHDFIDLSCRIAGVLHEQMRLHPAIASGAIAVVDYDRDGEGYLAFFKLNFKYNYSFTCSMEGDNCIFGLHKQSISLPQASAKPDEGAIIRLSDGSVKLIDKKVEMDGSKDFYLSAVLECAPAETEKKKIETIQTAAVAAVEEAYGDVNHAGEQVAVMMVNQAAENNNVIAVERFEEALTEQFPLAADGFKQAIAEAEIDTAEPVSIASGQVRKLKSRMLKTASGIEIKIPSELLASDSAVEFIRGDDGEISLLIRDVVL